MLTRDYYHAVTALGAREGEARRDILLFTVEPGETQVGWLHENINHWRGFRNWSCMCKTLWGP